MSLLKRLFTARPDARESLRPLWGVVVAEARRPQWYREAGASDTLAGRFDMVSAVFAAVLIRLEADAELAPASTLLTELFVEDMDAQLRELGVGDVIVGKRVSKLMGAMGGRLTAYRDGLASDGGMLVEAVRRNVTLIPGADPATIADGLKAFAERLERTRGAALLAGRLAP